MRGMSLEEVLKGLGWDDGFQIPVANAENQALEEEVAKLTLQKIKAKNSYDTVVSKVENLQSHLKHVKQESDLSQKLITVHRQQYEFERSNFVNLKNKKEGIEQDTTQTTKSIREVQSRREVKKAELKRGIEKLDKLKSEIDWDTEALKAWEDSLKRRDEDNEVLKKFSREDEKKFKDMESRRQILQDEHNVRKRAVEKMVSELVSYERITDRTGKALKQNENERDELVKQWKDAVNILHQRDDNIKSYERQIIEANEALNQLDELLEEQNQFLENERNNNTRVEFENTDLNVANSRLRKELNELSQYVSLIQSELATIKRLVSSAANNLEKQRAIGKQLRKEIKERREKIEKFKRDIERLRSKMKEIEETEMTTKERLQYLESLLAFEEKQHEVLMSDNERIQANLYHARQKVQDYVNRKKLNETQVMNLQSGIGQLKRHNKETLNSLQKKKEVVYDLDLRNDQIEYKIQKIENAVMDDEGLELQKHVQDLEEMLQELNSVRDMLQEQINRIEKDMSKLAQVIAQDDTQLSRLKDKIQNETMLYEGGQKIVAAAKKNAQEKQMEENMLRLRVNQFDRAMKKEEGNIFTLKKFRLNLEELMQERQLEIKASKEILLSKKRHLEDDLGRLKGDTATRHIKIDIVKKKYNTAICMLGKDEEGQPLTVAHVKIKQSQEKFLLEQEGDELDGKIQRAEKEIAAMENTLKVVNLTNSKFRRSLGIVDENDDEIVEMKSLEKQFRETKDEIKLLKKEMEEKREANEEIKAELTSLEELKQKARMELEEEQSTLNALKEKHASILEKITRTECNIKNYLKKLKKLNIEKFERDYEIRHLSDTNKSVTSRLVQLVQSCPEAGPPLKRYADEYGLVLPARVSPLSSESSLVSRASRCSCPSQPSSSSSTSRVSTVILDLNLDI